MSLGRSLAAAYFVFLAIVYLLAMGFAIRRRSRREVVVAHLALFLLASFVVELLHILAVLLWPGADWAAWLQFPAILLVAFVFVECSASFFSFQIGQAFRSAQLTTGVIAFLAVLAGLSLGLDLQQGMNLLARIAVLPGWILAVGGCVWMTNQALRLSKKPAYRNRIIYWTFALILQGIGAILLFFGFAIDGSVFCMGGALVSAYVILIHDVADLPRVIFGSLLFLLISMLAIGAYATGFVFTQATFQNVAGYSPVVAGTVLAIFLVMLLNPLIEYLHGLARQMAFGKSLDAAAIMREYSNGINRIVDLEFLAKTAVGVICETLKLTKGRLYLVDEQQADVTVSYRLTPVSLPGEELLQASQLESGKPLSSFFCSQRGPITLYDIDFLTEFRGITAEEKKWLSSQEADIFVPILSKGHWSGLLAFGQKTNGEICSKDELELLDTLASQTAVALENARLVSDLHRAQRALEQANQQLREINALKSSFISVITHELRSPFANIIFSLQLLEMYGTEQLLPEQREQLAQLSTGIRQARAMIENLVTFAGFMNRQIVICPDVVECVELVEATIEPLREEARIKDVSLQVLAVGEIQPIKADRQHLATAMYQLVQNAIKFTHAKGKVQVSYWTTGEALFFDVKDTGIGIPPDKLPALWSGLSQVADPVQRGVEGLGLGLGLVKYIIAAHGGRVWVESQPGEGSDFGFQIPLAPTTSPINPDRIVQIRKGLLKGGSAPT